MLDTSTVILLGEIADPAALPDESVISAITLAGLSVGPHVARSDDERSARQRHLQQAEADFEVLPFDADCARIRWGRRGTARIGAKTGSTRLRRTDRSERDRSRCRALHMQPRRF